MRVGCLGKGITYFIVCIAQSSTIAIRFRPSGVNKKITHLKFKACKSVSLPLLEFSKIIFNLNTKEHEKKFSANSQIKFLLSYIITENSNY
jgi:hypothetical protein